MPRWGKWVIAPIVLTPDNLCERYLGMWTAAASIVECPPQGDSSDARKRTAVPGGRVAMARWDTKPRLSTSGKLAAA